MLEKSVSHVTQILSSNESWRLFSAVANFEGSYRMCHLYHLNAASTLGFPPTPQTTIILSSGQGLFQEQVRYAEGISDPWGTPREQSILKLPLFHSYEFSITTINTISPSWHLIYDRLRQGADHQLQKAVPRLPPTAMSNKTGGKRKNDGRDHVTNLDQIDSILLQLLFSDQCHH